MERLLEHLEKSYAVDAVNQLDSDLACYLDYTWKKSLSVEQYIAGFHSRLEKIACLDLNNKLKGHLLLQKSALTTQNKNLVVGSASGNYDITHLIAAMRNAFMHQTPLDASMATNTTQDTGSNHHEIGYFKNQRNNTNDLGSNRPARTTSTSWSGQ